MEIIEIRHDFIIIEINRDPIMVEINRDLTDSHILPDSHIAIIYSQILI
jgi:hypothetical protein